MSLLIGVITSMFTAIFISRNLLAIIAATWLRRFARLFSPDLGRRGQTTQAEGNH